MKYTLGHQDFRLIRERGLVYVDKTEEVCRVANRRGYVFLSRPRRFGKSLTVATLAELYSGDRALFEGLWAYDRWDFAGRHSSVVWLKFASSGFGDSGIAAALHKVVEDNAARLNLAIPSREASPSTRFEALLKAAAAASPSGNTVLLVDEYDKPITHHIEGGGGGTLDVRPNGVQGPRSGVDDTLRALKAFYGILKDANPYLELVFITGVSAFSKVSLFSDLNNLTNLSLRLDAATLVGITEAELTTYFGEDIEATGVSRELVRQWYNGYRFAGGAERVYNPWSVLSFLDEGTLQSYWYETGTPTWLLDALVRDSAMSFGSYHVPAATLKTFDIKHIDPVGLLYQTGYLTIVDHDGHGRNFELDYPNDEVHEAFSAGLLRALGRETSEYPTIRARTARQGLSAGDVAPFVEQLDALLASIPHYLWEARRESAYHIAAHSLLVLIGMQTRSEVATARGRADTVVETGDYVYAFEFEVDRPVAEALAQVRERGYLRAYEGLGKTLVAVGVSFDGEGRRVGEWVAEH